MTIGPFATTAVNVHEVERNKTLFVKTTTFGSGKKYTELLEITRWPKECCMEQLKCPKSSTEERFNSAMDVHHIVSEQRFCR